MHAGKLLWAVCFVCGWCGALGTEGWRCDQVSAVLDEIWDAYIRDYQDTDPSIMFQLDVFFTHAGYKLNTTEDRHTLACQIIDSPDLNHLSEALGLPYLRLYHHYKLLEGMLEQEGGMMNYYYILTGLDLFLSRFSDWAERTHFPEVPIDSTYADILEFFDSLKQDFGGRVFKEVGHNMPFMTEKDPIQLATLILGAENERELIDALHTSRWALRFALDSYMQDSFTGRVFRALRTGIHTQVLPMQYSGYPYEDLRISDQNNTAECQELHDLFLDILEASQNPQMVFYPAVFMLSGFLKRDLLNPDDLFDFACSLSTCESLEDISELTNISLSMLQGIQQSIQQMIHFYGGQQGLQREMEIYDIVLKFGEHTGFPTFPLEDVSQEDVMTVLESISPGPNATVPSLVYGFIPVVTVGLEDIASILMEAETFDECYGQLYPNQTAYDHSPQLDDVEYFMDLQLPSSLEQLQLASRALDLAVRRGFLELN